MGRIARILLLGDLLESPARGGADYLGRRYHRGGQGSRAHEKNRETSFGQSPGTTASPYRRSPGSKDTLFGSETNRRFQPLSLLTRRPGDPADIRLPGSSALNAIQGLAPAVERLQLPAALPPGGSAPPSRRSSTIDDEDDDPEAAEGMTLDDAMGRLVVANRGLLTKAYELLQADADILTASLLENPLIFYSSSSVPYGKTFSTQRPGDVDHGISLVDPLDISGKRKARIEVARQNRCVVTEPSRPPSF